MVSDPSVLRADRSFACQAINIYDLTKPDRIPGLIMNPTYSLSDSQAQTLMDDLWRAGLRPAEGKASDRTLEAKDEHLKDMRGLVEKFTSAVIAQSNSNLQRNSRDF